MQITRELLKSILPEIYAPLLPLAEKYGLSFSLGDISFDKERFNLKVEAAIKETKSPDEPRVT